MFLISKLLPAITQPMFWLALWWALALLILKRRRRPAVTMLWSGLVMLGIVGVSHLPGRLVAAPGEPLPRSSGRPSSTVRATF